jgi:hypothetical protein
MNCNTAILTFAVNQKVKRKENLEAFSVDNGWTSFIVILLGDPHGLECGEGSKDGTSDPDRVFSLWWSNDLDLHGGWSKSSDFLLHSVGNTWVHGGTSGEDVVSVQVLTDVNVALHDSVVGGLMDTSRFHTNEGWLEEGFWATESFVSDGDDLTVGKLIALLEGGGGGGGGHLGFEVQGNIAKFFLDVSDDFTFSGGDEGVSSFSKDLHEVVSKISTGQVHTGNGVGKGITFIDWDIVGNTISRVQDDTGGTSGSVEGEDSLDANIHGWVVEGFKHDLGHLFTVSLGVQWGFSEEGWVLFWGNTHFVHEGVMPDLFHIIPVGDDTVFNGVFQGKDTSLGLGFITDIAVFLTHTNHNTLMARTANNGWEDGSWCIVSGETALNKSGTVVAY